MHSALSTQHSILGTQHSALSTQHSALDTRHSVLSTQHSALGTQHSALSTQHSTLLGFDFGLKRIGIAVGETVLKLAHPLTTIAEEGNDKRFAAIAALIAEWQPALLVVGLPAHSDGVEHEMSAQCRRFARRLEGRFGLKAVLVDERLSSASAGEDLSEIGIRGRRQKAALDQVAAQRILQSFLDNPHDAIA